MFPQAYEREWIAILSADIAENSRLMGEDDDAKFRTLTGHREMVIAK